MPSQTMHSKKLWKQALRHSLPVAMGYYPAGIAFGVLMSAAGLPLLLTILSSLIVYSGAAQYASIPLFATGASIITLTLNTAIINLRHIFYAIPLLPHFPQPRWQRLYCYFALTDESFSILTTLPENQRQHLFLRIVALNQFYWLSASIIGYLLGTQLNSWIPNLDFALPCLFMILWYEQFNTQKTYWPSLLAIFAFLLAKNISQDYLLLLSVGLSALGILIYPSLEPKHTNKLRPWFTGSLILASLLLFFLLKNTQKINITLHETGSMQHLSWQIISIFCMGFITFLLRFAPAAIPKSIIRSARLHSLNAALPLSVMTILILASLQLDIALQGNIHHLIAQIAALFMVYLIHRFHKNVLLSMIVGVSTLNLILSI